MSSATVAAREPSRQVLAGAGFTMLAHLATVLVPMVLALWLAAPDNAYDEDRTWFFLYGSLLGQILLLLLTIIVGISRVPRSRARTGVFVGWGLGLIAMPLLWFILWQTVVSPL